MPKTRYLSEHETTYNCIDEKEYFKRRTLDFIEKTYLSKKYCTYEQRIVLRRYYNSIVGKNKVKSPQSIKNVIYTLALFSQFIKKPFSMVRQNNIDKYLANQTKNNKFNTANTRSGIVKRFFEWYERPELVADIKILKPEENKLRKEDLLSKQEIKDMINACCSELYRVEGYNGVVDTSVRDKLLIMMLYELGCRRAEPCSISLKDIEDNKEYFLVTITGKTGTRTLPLVETAPYLREWLEIHPFKTTRNAPLFISVKLNEWGRRLLDAGVSRIIAKTFKRAGIKKRVYPHLFRHTRATYLAYVKKWTERELRIWFGWKADSNMPNRYVHFAQDEVNKKYIKEMGIFDVKEDQKQNEEDKLLNVKKCSSCGLSNPATNIYCQCGYPLDLKEFVKDKERMERKTDNIMNQLFSDPEFKTLLTDFLRKKNTETKKENE